MILLPPLFTILLFQTHVLCGPVTSAPQDIESEKDTTEPEAVPENDENAELLSHLSDSAHDPVRDDVPSGLGVTGMMPEEMNIGMNSELAEAMLDARAAEQLRCGK